MAYIYYIWSGDAHGRGGYIGLDSGSPQNKNSRIVQHIYGPKGINSKTPDGAARFIADKGISNVFYGYWDESENYGIPQLVFDEFEKTGWVADSKTTSGNKKLMSAEIFHIIYDLEHNLERTNANTTIGGQSSGAIVYNPKKSFAGKPLESVKIHLGDRAMAWENEKKKLFFPEQYAITREIFQQHLYKFLHIKETWNPIIERYVVPRLCGRSPSINPSTYLDVSFMNYLRQLDASFSWDTYNIETPNINFDKFVDEFEKWFINSITGVIKQKIKKWDSRKTISAKLFHIYMQDYVKFKPKDNRQPHWYRALQSQSLLVPNNRTPSNSILVNNIQIAATKVFNHIFDNTPTYNISQYTYSPPPGDYFRTRVEVEMKKYGFNPIHFIDWQRSYRYYVSYWLSSKNKSLIFVGNSASGDKVIVSAYNYPRFRYSFIPHTWNLIQSITKPKHIPFHML